MSGHDHFEGELLLFSGKDENLAAASGRKSKKKKGVERANPACQPVAPLYYLRGSNRRTQRAQMSGEVSKRIGKKTGMKGDAFGDRREALYRITNAAGGKQIQFLKIREAVEKHAKGR